MIRTVYRVAFSHKTCFDNTAADTEARSKTASPVISEKCGTRCRVRYFVDFSCSCPGRSPVPAAAAAAAWLSAPFAVYIMGRPVVRKQSRLTDDDPVMLREVVEEDLEFFEDFPLRKTITSPTTTSLIRQRNCTQDSPTNIGLLPLVMSAHDMGYISADGLAERSTRKHAGKAEKAERPPV